MPDEKDIRRQMLSRLRNVDCTRRDETSVYIGPAEFCTIEQLEALLYLMKERANWTLDENGCDE